MSEDRTILITGGAGFIGSNLAQRLLAQPNTQVRIFDDLSRRGVTHNLAWLQSLPQSPRLEWIPGDIRDAAEVARAAEDATEIYHLAAQVAVTTSLDEPRHDLEINVLGTFNVLEAARRSGNNPFLLFTSTNKVYGSLHGVPVAVEGTQYRGTAPHFQGVTESEPLDFHSPYGCSKGAADQYVRDYARIYGMKTVVFRQSCVYGTRQFGIEDQGWVAWFCVAVTTGQPFTIFGDGKQIRDTLWVDDLIDAYTTALDRIDAVSGQVFNLGGGPANTLSLLELVGALERHFGRPMAPAFADWRPGDQPVFVADIRKAGRMLDWSPRVGTAEGVARLLAWIGENRGLFTA